jgi:hypothetical protein
MRYLIFVCVCLLLLSCGGDDEGSTSGTDTIDSGTADQLATDGTDVAPSDVSPPDASPDVPVDVPEDGDGVEIAADAGDAETVEDAEDGEVVADVDTAETVEDIEDVEVTADADDIGSSDASDTSDAETCDAYYCASDEDCDDGDPCTSETCDLEACGTCLVEPVADGEKCGPGYACFGGKCEATTTVRGVVNDPYLYPLAGVPVRVANGAETVTDASGRFTLITPETGEVVVHYATGLAGAPWADHHKIVDLDAFAAQGVEPNASTYIKAVGTMERAYTLEWPYPMYWSDVAFGGLHVAPYPIAGWGGWSDTGYLDSNGAPWPLPQADFFSEVYIDGIGLTLTTVTPNSLYQSYQPDIHRALRVDGSEVALRPLLLFEIGAWGLNVAGEPVEHLDLEEGYALAFDADVRLDGQLTELCGNATYAETHPIWWLDPDTGIWMEVDPWAFSNEFDDWPPGNSPGLATARVNQGRCYVTGHVPGKLGWWAIGPADTSTGCLSGTVEDHAGNGIPGARVDGWSTGSGGLGHTVTDADGAYCLPVGDGWWVTLQARRFEGELELSSSYTVSWIPDPGNGSCDEGGCEKATTLEIGSSCVEGFVVDGLGQPVADAEITTSNGSSATTDESGFYCVEAPSLRDTVVQARGPDGTPHGTASVAWLVPGSCGEGCLETPAFKPAECNTHADCAALDPLPPDFEDVGMRCDQLAGICQLEVAPESALMEHLARLYNGTVVAGRRADRRDASGETVGCQLPNPNGLYSEVLDETPVQGTCCSSGGLGGPDSNGNNRCDHAPGIWGGTPPPGKLSWADLVFGIGAESRQVFQVEPAADGSTITFRLRSDADCDGLAHEVALHAQVSPDGCGLEAPTELEVIDETGTTYTVPLTSTQPLLFGVADSVQSLNPHFDALEIQAAMLVDGAMKAFDSTCTFPPNQGMTPIEGTCCSSNGLGGPDADEDNLCDVDPAVWNTTTWNTLAFAPEEPHPFVFDTKTLSTGVEGVSRYAIRAYADLDCDAVMSTFAWFVDGFGSVEEGGCISEPLPGFYSRSDGE